MPGFILRLMIDVRGLRLAVLTVPGITVSGIEKQHR